MGIQFESIVFWISVFRFSEFLIFFIRFSDLPSFSFHCPTLKESFDKSMKILESHIAESITNKEKLNSIKKDLKEANEKFLEAERCLDELKVDLENPMS